MKEKDVAVVVDVKEEEKKMVEVEKKPRKIKK